MKWSYRWKNEARKNVIYFCRRIWNLLLFLNTSQIVVYFQLNGWPRSLVETHLFLKLTKTWFTFHRMMPQAHQFYSSLNKSLTEERWTGSLIVTCAVLVESHHYWPADPGTMMQWDCQMKTMTRNLQHKPICVENSITRQGGLTVLNERSTQQGIWEPNDGITSRVTWNQSLCQMADSSN